MWLAASPLGDLLWQGEREVMWDTVQLSATHTLQLSRQPRDAAETDAFYATVKAAHLSLIHI